MQGDYGCMEQLKAFQQNMKTQIASIEQELTSLHHALEEVEIIEKQAKLYALHEVLAQYECMFAEELTPLHVKMSGTKRLYVYNDVDYRTIEQLDFTFRTYIVLKRANYHTAQQLREVDLEEIPNISKSSIAEIRRKLNL